MNKYYEIRVEGYERVVKCVNNDADFFSYIAVHNTKFGPSLGGCRFVDRSFVDISLSSSMEDYALSNVLSLSRAMTFKNCFAELPYGGGKSIVIGKKENKKEILKYMADFVNYLKGIYIIAEDSNISCDDLDTVRELSNYVVEKSAGDPSPVTAKGVYLGIKESWKFLNEQRYYKDLKDAKILVYGVGAVGRVLVDMLAKSVSKIHIFDINEENINKVLNKHTNVYVERDMFKIMCDYDIFCPCALGGTITESFAEKTEAKLIAGCANNQLASPEASKILLKRNILYAPDYVINAGGVIQLSGIVDGVYQEEKVNKKLKLIPKKLRKIFNKSIKKKIPTNEVADRMVIKALYL